MLLRFNLPAYSLSIMSPPPMSRPPYVENDLPDNRYWAAVGLDASAGQSDKA